ncbi:putative ORFan [Tupanvirus deep ocean]|uniref:ORFan n=2 Tax=Tupanvirus TaxID=2094720 RepID=A0AC62A9D5_9VIRU|nr:putative ORFan [Tupanvirus deep ocean]QKU34370.1 putative ORFan [Tupanvirus deep ocean]
MVLIFNKYMIIKKFTIEPRVKHIITNRTSENYVSPKKNFE